MKLGGWRPWYGKPRARDVLCLLAIVVSAVYAVAAIPLTPVLIASHPVLLELLTGSTSSIISAGAFSDVDTRLQLALVVVAALPGIMRFDWVYWWAGRLWGHRIVERLGQRSPRMTRLAGLAEARGQRWAGPMVALAAFLPGGASTAVYAAAGWAGLPLLAFVLWDTLGSAAWISVVAFGGYLLGSDGVTLAQLVSRYATGTHGGNGAPRGPWYGAGYPGCRRRRCPHPPAKAWTPSRVFRRGGTGDSGDRVARQAGHRAFGARVSA